MATINDDEAAAIRERMQRLRNRLDDRATQLAASTEELLDWKTYAKRYPVTLVVAGLVSGLFVAPGLRSGKPAAAAQATSSTSRNASEEASSAESVQASHTSGILSSFIRGTVSPFIRQFAFSYAKGLAAIQLDRLLTGISAQAEVTRPASHQPNERVSV